ncbi:MAG: DUF4886 domain-containing protein [Muribaculaceae bacterium]|nr:DUF4886 domain-containing protein [Muribaculaceae bacterium]
MKKPFLTILWLGLCAMAILPSWSVTRGDLTGNDIVDVADVNAVINIILKNKSADSYIGNADMNEDGIIDVCDVNTIINIILKIDTVPVDTIERGWVPVMPMDTIQNQMISTATNLMTLGNSRMMVCAVRPGDSLRITIDHDNTIAVNMKSWVVFDGDSASEWTSSHALTRGPNLRAVEGRQECCLKVPDGAKTLVCSGYFMKNGRIGDESTAVKNPFTAFKVERWDTLAKAPVRRTLKVLAVGNSFSCDELSYLPYVAQSLAPDVDLTLRLEMRPSGNIVDWAADVDADSVGKYFNRFYEWKPFPGRWSRRAPATLRQSVMADDWDVIVFQQVSTSPYWATVDSSLTALTSWLRHDMNYEGKIGWLLTHAYSDSDVVHSEEFYPTIKSSDEMWRLNAALADSVMRSGLVDVLIPSGTAVQIARHSDLSRFTYNQLCAGVWNDSTSLGDIHLQEGVGPFVAACAAAGVLLNQSPVGARVDLGSWWMIPNANPSYTSPGSNPTLEVIEQYLGGLGMDDASQQLATECAAAAIEHPYSIGEPEEPDSDPEVE